MDCSICNPGPLFIRPPRNSLCASCYEGASSITSLVNKLEVDKAANKSNNNSHLNSSKGFSNVLKWVKERKENEEEQNEKINFLSGFTSAYKDQLHTDIQINPGNNGHPIPAHRALLATKSKIFKNMLDSDTCKAAPNEAITLPELDHEELDSLLEFLYNGTLPPEKSKKHLYSLLIASDRYEIPYLQRFCVQRMLGSLNSGNALDVLEISDVCSNEGLKEAALNFIVKNMEDVIFSSKFDDFALKNPHLSVQITRASFTDIKSRGVHKIDKIENQTGSRLFI